MSIWQEEVKSSLEVEWGGEREEGSAKKAASSHRGPSSESEKGLWL